MRKGGIVAYPTDTSYGLGCDLFEKGAIEKIYQVKRLDKHHQLSFVVADLSDLSQYATMSDYAYRTMKRLLPGLPEQYRDVLQRIDLDGSTPKDAASALGLTTSNLTVRLHRARHRLRAELTQSCKVCAKHGCLDCSCTPTKRDPVAKK